MEEQKVMEEGFERYLVVDLKRGAMIVYASSFIDVLAELKESDIDEDDVISMTKIDLVEEEEEEEND
jgi:G3E family GTPase